MTVRWVAYWCLLALHIALSLNATQVRKRDPDFPANIRIYTKVEQPARRPHSDCSPRGAYMNLDRAFPGQQKCWEGKDFDVLK